MNPKKNHVRYVRRIPPSFVPKMDKALDMIKNPSTILLWDPETDLTVMFDPIMQFDEMIAHTQKVLSVYMNKAKTK